MNFWNENDLKVMELRDKIINLTEEFNKKNGKYIENYYEKLEGFLDRKLKKESFFIFKEQLITIASSFMIGL